MNDKIVNYLIIITIINFIITGVFMIAILIISLQNKYESTDVNKDGVTNSLDLLIVKKRILKEDK